MGTATAAFWLIVGCVLLPPLARFARNMWSLHQAKKRVVRIGNTDQ